MHYIIVRAFLLAATRSQRSKLVSLKTSHIILMRSIRDLSDLNFCFAVCVTNGACLVRYAVAGGQDMVRPIDRSKRTVRVRYRSGSLFPFSPCIITDGKTRRGHDAGTSVVIVFTMAADSGALKYAERCRNTPRAGR